MNLSDTPEQMYRDLCLRISGYMEDQDSTRQHTFAIYPRVRQWVEDFQYAQRREIEVRAEVLQRANAGEPQPTNERREEPQTQKEKS